VDDADLGFGRKARTTASPRPLVLPLMRLRGRVFLGGAWANFDGGRGEVIRGWRLKK